ncbi:MAG: homoserine dehydrogenase, partial [Sphaerochaetaceae bacterium]|nr:homoserine dehydrogenase [Sphaerochaetaceae bacterium]
NVWETLVRPGKKNRDFQVTDIDEITEDGSTDCVVECIGGTDDAYGFVKSCLEAGKHVVTSNKALVTSYGTELAELARSKGVGFLFSAACGGAVPVLHNISVAKQTDSVLSAGGILNGTVNFILSNLKSGKFTDYGSALCEARRLGYAEADPSADVSGLDTLRKVMLISAVAFGKLPVKGTCCEGIENYDVFAGCKYGTGEDSAFSDCCVKLIGRCGLNADGSVYTYVEPCIVKQSSVFAGVNQNFNFAFYDGKNCGRIGLSGQGAGRYPTASAVLRDLTALAQGQREMLGECSQVCADNSKVIHRYVVCEDSKCRITDVISVTEMHEKIRELRKKGGKVFFAAIEE